MSSHYDRESGERVEIDHAADDPDAAPDDYAGATGQPNDYPDAAPLGDPELDGDTVELSEQVDELDKAMRAKVDAALAAAAEQDGELMWIQRRAEAEHMQQQNDATLKRLAERHRLAVPVEAILQVRLAFLVEHVLGDMDAPRRIDYEHAVQSKFVELLADIESQVGRSKLLDGVRIDPRNIPGAGAAELFRRNGGGQ